MEVSLQFIFGLLLVVVPYCTFAEEKTLHQKRETPTSSTLSPNNVTEINNRDLNKIIKDNRKTELQESKSKAANNVHSFDNYYPSSGVLNENVQKNLNISQKKNSEQVRKLNNDYTDSEFNGSKFWSSEFQNGHIHDETTPNIINNVKSLKGTRHPSFENNSELTTPKAKYFDQKFKEAVESIDQKLENERFEIKDHFDHHPHLSDEDDEENDEINNESLAIDEFLTAKPNNKSSFEYEKTKSIINNETSERNSIHKDLNIEQTKKVSYVKMYNKTEVFDDDDVDEDDDDEEDEFNINDHKSNYTSTTQKTLSTSQNLKKPPKVINLHLLNNNKTESINIVPDSTDSSSEDKAVLIKEGHSREKATTKAPKLSVSETTTPLSSTTNSASTITANIADQENIIITLQSDQIVEPAKLPLDIKSLDKNKEPVLENKIIDEVLNEMTTSKFSSINFTPEETTLNLVTLSSINNNTTEVIKTDKNTDTTTEIPIHTESMHTSENILRTSKSLDNIIITDQIPQETSTVIEVSSKISFAEPCSETTKENIFETTASTTPFVVAEIEHKNIIEKSIQADETTTARLEITTKPSTTTTTEESTTTQEIISKINYSTEISPSSEETTISETTTNIPLTESTTIFQDTSVSSTETTTQTPLFSTTSQNNYETTFSIKKYTFVDTKRIDNNNNNNTTTSAATTTDTLPEISDKKLNSSTVVLNEDKNSIRKLSENNSSISTPSENQESSSFTHSNAAVTEYPITETVPTENSFTTDNEASDKGKIAAIVILCVGGVCLLLLVGLLYVIKRRQRRLNYGPRCRPVSLDDYSIDNLSVYNSVRRKGGNRFSKRSFGNPAFEDPSAPSHPLNFQALSKFSSNFEDIKAEFDDIPQISAKTSELPDGCDTKNRYANVIPLPETRVFIKPIDGYPNSDYINANYVTGPDNIKGYYIATQSPMQNTIDDFWRMVWEQQTKVILMLTHLIENGLEKCIDYLPASEVLECSRIFGDFQLTLKKREVKEKYIISSLQLKNMVSNSWREVTHFWYLGWPEKGVPAEGNSLIAFLIEARSYMKAVTLDKKKNSNGLHNIGATKDHSPVIVHCSPGTGRTGVAIACDTAIRDFETTRLVDIPKIVYKIRRNRANAVQTKEQYNFIYKVVNLYATKLTGGVLENV